MKTRFARIVFAILLLVMLLSALGCGATGRAVLYGRWKMTGNESVWEFKSDGGLILEMSPGKLEARYVFLDDDTISISPPEGIDSENLVLDFKVEGDQLTLSAEGADEIFTREK